MTAAQLYYETWTITSLAEVLSDLKKTMIGTPFPQKFTRCKRAGDPSDFQADRSPHAHLVFCRFLSLNQDKDNRASDVPSTDVPSTLDGANVHVPVRDTIPVNDGGKL